MNIDSTDPAGAVQACLDYLRSNGYPKPNQRTLAQVLDVDQAQLSKASRGKISFPKKMQSQMRRLLDGELRTPDDPDDPPPAAPSMLPAYVISEVANVQQRVQIDPQTVKDYVAVLEETDGWPFPPLVVFKNPDESQHHWQYILADGFHRLRAILHVRQADTRVPVELREGGLREATLYAVGANAGHGLRRSADDKRNAVKTLLRDPEWSRRSDRWIAEAAKVSPTLVGKLRTPTVNVDGQSTPSTEGPAESEPAVESAEVESKSEPAPKTRTGKDGRTTNTAKIGKKAQPVERPAEIIRRHLAVVSAALGALRDRDDEIKESEAFELCQRARDTLIHYRAWLKDSDWDAMLEKLCQEEGDAS